MDKMESMRKPELAISLTTAASLIGASVYFYKKIQVVEDEQHKLDEHLSTSVTKLNSIMDTSKIHTSHIKELATSIKQLHAHIQKQNNILDEYRNLIDYHHDAIEIIVNTFRDNGYDIRLPRMDRRLGVKSTPLDYDRYVRSDVSDRSDKSDRSDRYERRERGEDRREERREDRREEKLESDDDLSSQIDAVRRERNMRKVSNLTDLGL